jgi:hypothetical protein
MRLSYLVMLGGGMALALAVEPVGARPLPQTTPLRDANLFISPSGQPYRSSPGEPYPVVMWFNATDTNHDGKVDRAEFRAEAETFFHQLDLRKNGVIDDEIINLYEKKVVPEILVGAGNVLWRGGVGGALFTQVQLGGGGAGGGAVSGQIVPGPPATLPEHPGADNTPQGAAVYGLLNDAEPLRSADRSFRSQLKLQDMLDQADRNFDALDVDRRGYLTLEDLPRTPAQTAATLARKR